MGVRTSKAIAGLGDDSEVACGSPSRTSNSSMTGQGSAESIDHGMQVTDSTSADIARPFLAQAHVMASISFRATSNQVEATRVTASRVDLKHAIMQNAAFSRAFESHVSGPAGRSRQVKSGTKPSAHIIQSSEASACVIPTRYGLVSAALDAYNTHHNLILRPDDVWQAILTQFSFYVNANAEELRDCFVDFDGKKTLVIVMGGNPVFSKL